MLGYSLENPPDDPSEEEKRKREGPREKKKNGIGGVWGKLKESGHRTGRNTSREGTGNCLRGNRAWEEKKKWKGKWVKKAKIKRKEKPRQSRAAEIAEGPKVCKDAPFRGGGAPQFLACRLTGIIFLGTYEESKSYIEFYYVHLLYLQLLEYTIIYIYMHTYLS